MAGFAVRVGLGVGVGFGSRLALDHQGACRRRAQVVSIRAEPGRRLDMGNITLWIVQVILAALFLFAGGTKLAVPIEMLTAQMPLPGVFLRFIGLCCGAPRRR